MAKSSAKTKDKVKTPAIEFPAVWEAGTTDEAMAAIGEDGREAKMFMVPFEAVHPIADFNIRIHDEAYEAHIEKLKESMVANNFFRHRPLKVFPALENGQTLLYLADGYSRYEAAKRAVAEGAKIPRLPVVPTPKGTSMDDLLIGLDADNDSRPLAPFEKAIIVKRLSLADNDEDEIANKMRITRQYVDDLLSLMAAPKTLHNMVTSGEVAAHLAINLMKEHGSAKKAIDVLKAAGATGESATPPASGGKRVTRSQVSKSGGTANAGKRLYEALIEYLIVLGGISGAQSAYDFLIKWNEKDPDALKELSAKLGGKKKAKGGKKAKAKNPKDVRIKITDDMSDEQKKEARAHNKIVKQRKERREAKAAAEAAAKAEEAGDKKEGDSDDDPL